MTRGRKPFRLVLKTLYLLLALCLLMGSLPTAAPIQAQRSSTNPPPDVERLQEEHPAATSDAAPAVSAMASAQSTATYHQITDNVTGQPLSVPVISGNGEKVAFDIDGKLYLANSDGSGSPQLISEVDPDNPPYEYHSAYSVNYDGDKVLYVISDSSSTGGEPVFVNGDNIPPCLSDPRISENVCLEVEDDNQLLAISGNGEYVFLLSRSRWQCAPYEYEPGKWTWKCAVNNDINNRKRYIWRVPVVGGEAELWSDASETDALTWDLATDYYGAIVVWSGRSITSGKEEVYASRGGSQKTRIFVGEDANYGEGRVQISADGNWVVFGRADRSCSGEHHDIHIFKNDGSSYSSIDPYPFPAGNSYDVRGISEEGARILFESDTSCQDPDYRTFFVNRDGSDLTPLLSNTTLESKISSLSYNGRNVAFISDEDILGNGNAQPQVFVLKDPATPDLRVDAFSLNPADVTRSSEKYILPVDLTVRNAGEASATDFQVRFSDNGGWSENRNIASLAPSASTELHLDWDITTLLKQGDGEATIELTVTADPDDTIFESAEINNMENASTDVDARPRILKVRPQFRLASAYFLNNQSVNNPVKVLVDWNGDLSGNGEAPYGDVYFDLNGDQIQENGQQWGAQHTYDMGDDFKAKLSCANNTLQIWIANDDFESLKTSLQPTVFPFPGWVEWTINNIPGSDTSFKTEAKVPLVEYSYDFKYPEPAFEATWEPEAWVPYLGGEEIGVQTTQAEANATGQSDGAGAAGVAGNTGLALAAFTSEGKLWGQGEAQFICGESLDLERAVMGFSIHTTVEKEAGLTEVIPGAKASEDWPVVGRILRWVNSKAMVKGSFTPGVEIETEFEEKNDELEFVHGEGTGSIDARAELATEACEDLTASIYGGGTPYVTMQVPAQGDPETYLKEVGINLYYGATFQAWEFEEEYKREVNCNYPGGCEEVKSQRLMAMAHDEPTWRLIPHQEPAPMMSAAGMLLQATSITTETELVSPVYARPEPALAVANDGTRLLAYVGDDAGDPDGRHTEIRARIWDGTWSGADEVTDDEQPDFAPAVAFDGGGNGVAIWERSTLPAGVMPSLNITFAQSLEIAAGAWNGSNWSAPVTLTNDGLMDFAPRLSSGSDGSVMALWQTNDGTDMLGTAAHPLTYTYALWDGTGWLTPTAALTGLHDVVGTAFAAYSSTQAALVYAVDADGEMTTTADADLYYSTFDGSDWSGPTRLMTDTTADAAPALAYDADGSRHLLWLRGRDLVWLEDSWDIGDVQMVRTSSTEGGFLGFELSRDLNGNLSLIWQTMGDDGADLAYSIYDAAHDAWGADQALTSDADVETAHSPTFADGSLYLAYQKIETEFVTKTLSGASGTFTVTNVPTPGVSSLIFLEHTVGRDLTFDSLTISPPNPAAGQQVTLTTVLRNAGDLTVSSPQVAFYDGVSQIGSIQTLPHMSAGTTTTVEGNWTAPSAAAHTLKAIADPNAQVAETDETNNEVTATTTLPDLQMDVLYTNHSSQAITITARLTNAGVLTASAPFTVAFRAADPVTGTLIAITTVNSSITTGSQFTFTQTLTDPASLTGLGNTLWAVADDGDVVAEIDETNNTAYSALGAMPDLTLAAEDVHGSGPLAVTVHNAGVITAAGAALSVRQGAFTGTLLYSSTLGALGPGAVQTVTLSPSAGQFELWVKADPDNAIVESNEGNNLAMREVEIPNHIYLPLILRNAEL